MTNTSKGYWTLRGGRWLKTDISSATHGPRPPTSRRGLDAQLRDLKAACCRKVFSEQASAVGERRSSTQPRLLPRRRHAGRDQAGPPGALSTAPDRAVDKLESKGVTLRILNFGGDAVDTRGATGRSMLNMFAAMAQFEREMMLERQREGIAKAKAEGKYKGRKPSARLEGEQAVQIFSQGKRVAHIAKELGIGRGSVYRALEAAGLSASWGARALPPLLSPSAPTSASPRRSRRAGPLVRLEGNKIGNHWQRAWRWMRRTAENMTQQ